MELFIVLAILLVVALITVIGIILYSKDLYPFKRMNKDEEDDCYSDRKRYRK